MSCNSPCPRTPKPHAKPDGFTLVELLTVIFIIALLMGLLIPTVTIIKNMAKKAKAAQQLAQIQAALKVYKDANGVYPEMDYSVSPGVVMSDNAGNNAAGLLLALKSVDRENFREPLLLDPYRNVVRYRPAKTYKYDTGKAKGTIDSDDPPGADTYQLWSTGPNGRDDVSGTGDPKNLGDDIVIWK